MTSVIPFLLVLLTPVYTFPTGKERQSISLGKPERSKIMVKKN